MSLANRLRRGLSRPWWILLLACLLAVTGAEMLLLGVGTGYFTSGYNSEHLDSWLWLAVFTLAGAAMDLALILGIWALVLPLGRLLRATALQLYCLAGLVAVGGPVAVAAARYNLYSVLGDMFSVALAQQSSQLSSSAMAAEVAQEGNAVGAAVAAGLMLSLLLLIAARRVESRWPSWIPALQPPAGRTLLSGLLAFGCLGAALLALSSPVAAQLLYGFDRKTSAILITRLVEGLSDVDRDGYGLLSRPPDSRFFDAKVHPYAPERAGNGIDENGLAGDLPAGQPAAVRSATLPAATGATPHLLLVYLESFRTDLLEQRIHGREITPFLNRLARQGASARHAYVHSPSTLPSRTQLFTGLLTPRPGGSTLIDDFQERGYHVAHFSGQDDSYGDSVAILGADRADAFYDARSDVDRRTSRSTAPVSLQVSWKTLVERALQHLEGLEERVPIFLYVNVVDTHYPYFHDEIDAILEVEPLSRSQIRSARARQVWEAYANTAANVDRAVEQLVAGFRKRIGGSDHAILVTADHGQSFYAEGLLGHGQSLDDAQARVPLILWGMGGDWPEPIAPSDLRGLLRRHLGQHRESGRPRARFVPDPQRRVFQYLGSLEKPRRVALRSVAGRDEYDFLARRFRRLGPGEEEIGSPDASSVAFETLIWRWEAEQLESLAASRKP